MITCIIPFYNEKESFLKSLTELKKISSITQIICVDDGSDNTLHQKIKKEFPTFFTICHSENLGKSEAVKTGIKHAKNPYILLFDADLQNVNGEELEKIIQKFLLNPPAMLIFQVKTTHSAIDGFINRYVIFSGTRILKKSDLIEVLRSNPKNFEIEPAINDYFIKHKKTVLWTKCSLLNTGKIGKIGAIKGLLVNTRIELDYIRFSGIKNHIKQLFFFARKELR